MKIIICTLLTASLLNGEINKTVFDIDVFKDSLFDYTKMQNSQLKSNCVSMLKKLSNDAPSNLRPTYDSITKLTRNVFDAADVLYAQKPDPKLVKKAIDDLVKEQASAKRSFFGTKFIQGAKNLFVKKEEKANYNDMKKLFNDIFDVLSSMISKMKDQSKKMPQGKQSFDNIHAGIFGSK